MRVCVCVCLPGWQLHGYSRALEGVCVCVCVCVCVGGGGGMEFTAFWEWSRSVCVSVWERERERVLSENWADPKHCVRSERANFQPWQPLPKFLGRRTAQRGRRTDRRGGKEGEKGKGSGREGFSYTKIWSLVIKCSREANCNEPAKKKRARISTAFSISTCGQARFFCAPPFSSRFVPWGDLQ